MSGFDTYASDPDPSARKHDGKILEGRRAGAGSALTAAPAAAPAGGTGTAAGGWDTAGNRDAAIATINTLRTRVGEIEAKLRSIGLVP